MRAALMLTIASIALFSPQVAQGKVLSLGPLAAQCSSLTNCQEFSALSHELATSIQPRFGAPAHTFGVMGMDVGYNLVMTNINQNDAHWELADQGANDLLLASQVSVQKGLPYSIGLGATLTHLHDYGLWGVDLQLKFAFAEGYEVVPDIGMRIRVGSLLGSRELSMLTTGTDLIMSKTFGVAGVMQMTPFAAYAFTLVRSSSMVVGVFEDNSVEPETEVLKDHWGFVHRGLAGMRFTFSFVDLGFEAAIGAKTQTYALRLAFVI